MRDEELKILKMLEEGKITAEEAETLLSALQQRSVETKNENEQIEVPDGVNIVSFVGKLVTSILGMVPGWCFRL